MIMRNCVVYLKDYNSSQLYASAEVLSMNDVLVGAIVFAGSNGGRGAIHPVDGLCVVVTC